MGNVLLKSLEFLNKIKQSGFGIAETMVSIAILGVVTVGIISQQRLSVKSSMSVASEAEINNTVKRIISELSTNSVCSLSENFGGQVISSTVNYTSLQRTSGALTATNKILVVDEDIGTGMGQIVVSKITTRAKSPTNNDEMILELSFKKKESSLLQKFTQRAVTREIPFNVVLDASNKIAACFGNYDLVVKTAIELSCVGKGAQYIATNSPPYGECHHVNVAKACPVGQALKKIVVATDPSDPTITTGPVDYVCGSIETTCPVNYFVTGFKADGNVICNLAYRECNDGEVIVKNAAGDLICGKINCSGVNAFAGFDSTGTAICTSIPTSTACGTNNFPDKVNPDGSVVCNSAPVLAKNCAVNERVQGIGADGIPVCVPFVNLPKNCSPGAVDGVDASGNITCKPIARPINCGSGQTLHSYAQCRAAAGGTGVVVGPGGAAVGTGSVSVCKFSGTICPGGWNRCNLYGNQSTNSCFDTSNTYYCDANRTWRSAVPFGGNTLWQNNNQSPASCITWSGYPNTSHACYASVYATINSNQDTVGCY